MQQLPPHIRAIGVRRVGRHVRSAQVIAHLHKTVARPRVAVHEFARLAERRFGRGLLERHGIRLFPAAVNLPDHLQHVAVPHVAAHEHRRVVRHVIRPLHVAHLRHRRAPHDCRRPARIPPPRGSGEQVLVERGKKNPPRIRLVRCNLGDDHFLFVGEFLRIHERRAHRIRPEFQSAAHLTGRHGKIVAHRVNRREAVPVAHAHAVERGSRRRLVGILRVPLEHHVLVQVEQARRLVRLRNRPRPHRQHDERQWRGMVFHDE